MTLSILKKNCFLAKLLFIALIFSANSFAAAPYCALRDPSHQIYAMFPSATSYRSVVRKVDALARQSLNEKLPFTLHHNELGEHTIYVPVQKVMPLGIVHVRSEMGVWGLMEIVWALDRQMKVVDFKFQRCRGDSCKTVIEKNIKSLLQGKGERELADLLDENKTALKHGLLELNDSELYLAGSIIKSAIKTIAVTKGSWPDTVTELQSVSDSKQ